MHRRICKLVFNLFYFSMITACNDRYTKNSQNENLTTPQTKDDSKDEKQSKDKNEITTPQNINNNQTDFIILGDKVKIQGEEYSLRSISDLFDIVYQLLMRNLIRGLHINFNFDDNNGVSFCNGPYLQISSEHDKLVFFDIIFYLFYQGADVEGVSVFFDKDCVKVGNVNLIYAAIKFPLFWDMLDTCWLISNNSEKLVIKPYSKDLPLLGKNISQSINYVFIQEIGKTNILWDDVVDRTTGNIRPYFCHIFVLENRQNFITSLKLQILTKKS